MLSLKEYSIIYINRFLTPFRVSKGIYKKNEMIEKLIRKIKDSLKLIYRHRALIYRCIFLLLIGAVIIFLVSFMTNVMMKWDI